MATPLLWMRQPDWAGGLGLALNAAHEANIDARGDRGGFVDRRERTGRIALTEEQRAFVDQGFDQQRRILPVARAVAAA